MGPIGADKHPPVSPKPRKCLTFQMFIKKFVRLDFFNREPPKRKRTFPWRPEVVEKMATSAEAIEAIVKAAGIPPTTVARAARTLKEAGGGINAVHARPHHLARNTGSTPARVEPQADFASEALENSERKIETSAP